MQKLIINAIKAYQYFISPILGQRCRYFPSCSHYSIEAIEQHGVLYGSFLSVKRILSCQPFCKGGHDPVPKKLEKKSWIQAG